MKSAARGKDFSRKINVEEFLKLFDSFTKRDRIKIAEKIAHETFDDRWALLDRDLPDIRTISDESIMQEVVAVRYGKKG